MPKKKVAIFFLLALLGAALFVYFTFPRTKDQIPKSNNQRPFAPPPEPGPNGAPVPETVPHPNAPKVPPGPSVSVMAWAAGNGEARALGAEADDFTNETGRHVLLTIDGDEATYRRDLHDAFAAGTPPDVCLIGSRDFSGLEAEQDLAEATPNPDTAARSIAAFTVNGKIRAVPGEFSVDVLFYNEQHFDRAGIAYPDRHWTWDIVEAIARALGSLRMKTEAGQPISPLELPADFDFWNLLCTEAGQPALDLGTWHLSDHDTREAQMEALGIIRNFFCGLSVTAPPTKPGQPPGALFAQQRSSLLVAPSDFAASLPNFRYGFTLMPAGALARATVARVNGWAVAAKSSDPAAARALAQYLAYQPVHAGWSRVQKPPEGEADTPEAICHEALSQALVPRLEPGTAALAQFLDEQINLMAHNSPKTTDALYAAIQAKFQKSSARRPFANSLPQPEGLNPRADASSPLRSF